MAFLRVASEHLHSHRCTRHTGTCIQISTKTDRPSTSSITISRGIILHPRLSFPNIRNANTDRVLNNVLKGLSLIKGLKKRFG